MAGLKLKGAVGYRKSICNNSKPFFLNNFRQAPQRNGLNFRYILRFKPPFIS